MRKIGLILFAGAMLANTGVQAQPVGDARQGRAFAQAACSQCHAVANNRRASPNPRAPSFRAIARAPAMTEMALHVWFRSPHPSMPQLILREADKDNVIAYILSLGGKK